MKTVKVALVWSHAPKSIDCEIAHGRLARTRRLGVGGGHVRDVIEVANARLAEGAFATRVTVRAGRPGFTFFLRDVSSSCPLLVPAYGVAVLPAADRRGYEEVAAAVRARGLVSEQQRIDAEPEETYEAACAANRDMMCPVWLGVSRDIRIFGFGYSEGDRPYGYWGEVVPRYHSVQQALPETDQKNVHYAYTVGRGSACRIDITRRLDEGVLPIVRSVQRDGEVEYHLTAFATLERGPLAKGAVTGTDYRHGYAHMGGQMLPAGERDRERAEYQAALRAEANEVVCVARFEAVNTGAVPRYAYFRTMACHVDTWHAAPRAYDGARGAALFPSSRRVYAVHRLNGKPMPQEEVAVLLQPGGSATVDYLLPHQPLPAARAARLLKLDVDAHLAGCRAFWRAKLAGGASARVPEPAVDERIRAGLLHCDVTAIGREPAGSVAATIGWYSPIGSESAPIIQFFDSMGWHKLAERSLMYFLDRQKPDGFIQNFGGYQLETGPALWSMGEHWRYTRDDAWVRRIKPKLLKSCEFLLAWRARNKRPALRGKGYGLIEGKVADPEDFFHSFMLNGVSYLGLARAAEMLRDVDRRESQRLAREAAAYRRDIRKAYYESLERNPLVPLGDGTWVPSYAPWTESPGPLSLYAEGGQWFTHGAFHSRDSIVGPLYLILGEVLDPDEPAAEFLLRSHQELHTLRNAAFTQPYYARHDLLHLKRGEVKAFLKTYYNQFAALQDRQAYTFWEHYFHASQHKTHEEAWFLMQTRWMLYLEDGPTLRLLPGAPRRWLEGGKRIELENVRSYFGPFSLRVAAAPDGKRIEAEVACRGPRAPKHLEIRIPHPAGRRASAVTGGTYDAARECVRVARFTGRASVTLEF